MSRLKKTYRAGWMTGLGLVLVLVAGCSTDSPTAPTQVPAPGPDGGANSWQISVSVDPETIDIGAEAPASVTVRVESRSDPGTFPINGTTIALSTSIGEFDAAGSEARSTFGILDRGRATVFLFPGTVPGDGTVTAQLSGSVGRRNVSVVETADPFISGISPNSGPGAGGTAVTISGTGFVGPVQVLFGDKAGTVQSVSSKQIQATTPAADPTASCGVKVEVVTAGGASAALSGGFTYTDGCDEGGGEEEV